MSKYRIVTIPVVCIVLIADHYQTRSKAKAEAEQVAKIDKGRFRNFRDTYWGMTRAQVKATEKWKHDLKTSGSEWYTGLSAIYLPNLFSWPHIFSMI